MSGQFTRLVAIPACKERDRWWVQKWKNPHQYWNNSVSMRVPLGPHVAEDEIGALMAMA